MKTVERKAATVETSLRSIARSLGKIADFVCGEYVSKIERIKDVLDEHEMWDSDALDEINDILFGSRKGGNEVCGHS